MFLTTAVTLAVLSGCASQPPAPEPEPAASEPEVSDPDLSKDLIELYFRMDAFTREAVIEGSLTVERPRQTYTFVAVTNEKLHLQSSGASIHVVLTDPKGETEGPDLAEEVALKAGRYLLTVSANTMAEGAYGPFRVELQINRAP